MRRNIISRVFFALVERGNVSGLKLVLPFVNPNIFDWRGVTPLVVASVNGNLGIVDLLLKSGADPNVRTRDGWFPHNYAKGAGHSEVLELLRRAHGGRLPAYDYRSKAMRDFDDSRLDVYRAAYGEKVLKEKPFYNIGAGTTYHPAWQNVDHMSDYYAGELFNNIDIDWDIAALGPLQVKSNSAIAVYTSHTVEHIMDAHAAHMFREAYRILKPGGFFRVTTPDIDIYYNALVDKDETFTLYKDMRKTGMPFEICFLNEFATQLREDRAAWESRVLEVNEAFSKKSYEDALNHFTNQIDFSIQQERVGMHVNWWNAEKITRMLKEVGFNTVYRSGYSQSRCPAMRDTLTFDATDVGTSVYVEAIKT